MLWVKAKYCMLLIFFKEMKYSVTVHILITKYYNPRKYKSIAGTHNSKDVLRRFTEPLFRFIHVNTARSENNQIQHWSFRLCEIMKKVIESKILQKDKSFVHSVENKSFTQL